MRVNGAGAGFVAETAAELKRAAAASFDRLCLRWRARSSLSRRRRNRPDRRLWALKLEGERQIAARCENCAVLRTAWVYSPFGANFVKTMLRLGETRDEIGVVADQIGNPTSALDIADALLAIAERLVDNSDPRLRGVFHMTGQGEASWADMADAIFSAAETKAASPCASSASPPQTIRRRPAAQRIQGSTTPSWKPSYGVALPKWRDPSTPASPD